MITNEQKLIQNLVNTGNTDDWKDWRDAYLASLSYGATPQQAVGVACTALTFLSLAREQILSK